MDFPVIVGAGVTLEAARETMCKSDGMIVAAGSSLTMRPRMWSTKLTSRRSWRFWPTADFAVRQMVQMVAVVPTGDFKVCFPGGKNFFARGKKSACGFLVFKII